MSLYAQLPLSHSACSAQFTSGAATAARLVPSGGDLGGNGGHLEGILGGNGGVCGARFAVEGLLGSSPGKEKSRSRVSRRSCCRGSEGAAVRRAPQFANLLFLGVPFVLKPSWKAKRGVSLPAALLPGGSGRGDAGTQRGPAWPCLGWAALLLFSSDTFPSWTKGLI